MSGLRGAWVKVAGLGTVAMIAVGLVGVPACATPIAMWSAYHSGSALQAERDRAAAAERVATETARQKVAIEKASQSPRRPAAPLCPGTVLDAIHGLSASRPGVDQ